MAAAKIWRKQAGTELKTSSSLLANFQSVGCSVLAAGGKRCQWDYPAVNPLNATCKMVPHVCNSDMAVRGVAVVL